MNSIIKFSHDRYTKLFYYYNDDSFVSKSILAYHVNFKRWTIIEYKNKIMIPNVATLTEEEYFQLSLVWDYKFPFDLVDKIIKKAELHNYNFSFFKAIVSINEEDI